LPGYGVFTNEKGPQRNADSLFCGRVRMLLSQVASCLFLVFGTTITQKAPRPQLKTRGFRRLVELATTTFHAVAEVPE
jgi:hypothetical protein